MLETWLNTACFFVGRWKVIDVAVAIAGCILLGERAPAAHAADSVPQANNW
jgi:hypothetical protein